ncbi:MAG: hypothetical protein INH13_25805 [Cupriavidus sp.]|nr:hypothetical protein [Cupriavidus sp.]
MTDAPLPLDLSAEIEAAIYAAAERTRRDPAGIIALKSSNADDLARVAQRHLRDLAGDLACTKSNIRHVVLAAEAVGPDEPATMAPAPRPVKHKNWMPRIEECKIKPPQECDERVGRQGYCLVCKARRKLRREAPPFSDELLRQSRKIRKRKIAYHIDGVAYDVAGRPMGPTYQNTRSFRQNAKPPPGTPYRRHRTGDEAGTVVLEYPDVRSCFFRRLRDFSRASGDQLADLLYRDKQTIESWTRNDRPIALGAASRDALRRHIIETIHQGASLLGDLDLMDACAAGEDVKLSVEPKD